MENLEIRVRDSKPLTVIKKSLDVDEDVGEGGQLLLVLKELRQVVGDALSVVVGRVAHL